MGRDDDDERDDDIDDGAKTPLNMLIQKKLLLHTLHSINEIIILLHCCFYCSVGTTIAYMPIVFNYDYYLNKYSLNNIP